MGKSSVMNFIVFCDEVTGAVSKGRAVDVYNLILARLLKVSHNLLITTSMSYRFEVDRKLPGLPDSKAVV